MKGFHSSFGPMLLRFPEILFYHEIMEKRRKLRRSNNILSCGEFFRSPEANPQRVFRLTPVRIFRVSYRDLCYSVLPCRDRDTIVVLHSLTPEKVGLPGSELPRSRSVMTSRCKQWFSFGSTFCTLERNINFSPNGNLQLKYQTKKYNLK